MKRTSSKSKAPIRGNGFVENTFLRSFVPFSPFVGSPPDGYLDPARPRFCRLEQPKLPPWVPSTFEALAKAMEQ